VLGVVIAVTLAACASAPTAGSGAAAQPLQRVVVPVDAQRRDLLAHLLAGEFAVGRNDLEGATREYAAAAALSDDPAVAEQAAHIAIIGKHWDAARSALARWQVLKPDDDGGHQIRAMLALHDGDVETAYTEFSRLLQQPDGAGWRAVSQALLNDDVKPRAGALAERLLHSETAKPGSIKPGTSKPDSIKAESIKPDSNLSSPVNAQLLGSKSETWIAVSQMAMRLERKALAQSLADQAVRRFATPEAYAWAAQLKLGAGDKDGARKLFADALRKNPHDAKTPRLRIAYAAMLGDLGDGVSAARVLAEGPQSDYTYAARAAYLARNDDKAAKPQVSALYNEVKALPEPRPAGRMNLLGQLSELLEHKSEALRWYAQVPSDDDHWFIAQMRTAVLLNDSGKSDEALNLLHELQARAGDDSKQLGETFMLEAELLNRSKRGDEAVAVYDRGLQALPDDTRLIYARALLNDDLNHFDAAVRDLRRVLELKPDDADAMNALGYTLADRTGQGSKDQISEALALIEQALKLKPGEPAIIDSLGWVQYRLGNIDAAVHELRNAFAKQPDPEIAAHLGEVLWVSGQKDEAKRVWEQGRAKSGDNKVLLETIKRLSS
jgi:tetratricopeptide (TPR) repeat protein